MNSKSFKLQKPIFFFFYNKLHQRFQFFMRNSKYFSWVMILAFAIIATNHSVSSRRTRNPFWFRIPSELPNSNQLNFFFPWATSSFPFSPPSCNTQNSCASNKHDSHFLPLSICSVHSKVIALSGWDCCGIWIALDLDFIGMDLDGCIVDW